MINMNTKYYNLIPEAKVFTPLLNFVFYMDTTLENCPTELSFNN